MDGNRIMCVDHNNLVVKQQNVFAPQELEHDSTLQAREQEVSGFAKASINDAWADVHCRTLMIYGTRVTRKLGFTYGFPKRSAVLDP